VLAASGNIDIQAEKDSVLLAQKIRLAPAGDVTALLHIGYIKSLRLGMQTRYAGRSLYGYPQVFMDIQKSFRV
jgi:hypothetical protein